ncbi:MoxR-like ATPase [Formivibrio citricus]|uniref:MoxR-like ATPase n=1 Tax=Formivibrio citricus TaxID=83765 RepID=A0A1I4Y8X7_9NEIS|nr:MoxR family ATPase [Formivibrio citricus]SFN34518.1 MoxR-like ATPase [Formivibrio citricus]
MNSALLPRFLEALQRLDSIILGKQDALRLALSCLLARGHLLIEDLPGVGKTTLAHALARVLGLKFQRVQFTSDLLPADITGVSIYDRQDGRFRFHPGPIFAQVLLADEINRATPKTQSALLEAMAEHQVTVDGESHPLPRPFYVIATQNPLQQIGAFPLPESQLDRFLMRLELGYPDERAERELLLGQDRRSLLSTQEPVLGIAELLAAQAEVEQVHISPALVDYVQALVAATRNDPSFACGLSPRAALGLIQASRAHAWLIGRNMVIPEDVQTIFPGVAGHRLVQRASGRPDHAAVLRLLAAIAIP